MPVGWQQGAHPVTQPSLAAHCKLPLVQGYVAGPAGEGLQGFAGRTLGCPTAAADRRRDSFRCSFLRPGQHLLQRPPNLGSKDLGFGSGL